MKRVSFFKSIHQPYYIFAPDFSEHSAGIRALHYLCHALNELGVEAYVVGCSEVNENLRTPRLTEEVLFKHLRLGLIPIMIYPEVVPGNPLNMPYVVRWLLNKPGYVGGEEFFDGSEVVFSYSRDYLPEYLPFLALMVPTIDNTIFNNIDNPDDLHRQGTCFYAHKYLAKGNSLTDHVLDSTSLCQDVNLTPKELAEVLRKSELLYCYEPSAIITEARLCGCPVIMIPSPFLDENLNSPLTDVGIAAIPDETCIAIAKDSVRSFSAEHEIHLSHSWEQVKQFIDHTQSFFPYQELGSNYNENDWLSALLTLIDNMRGRESVANPILKRRLIKKSWLQANSLQEGQVAIMAENMVTKWHKQPTFHFIMVLNQHELALLSDTLNSLQEQLYSAWGLTIISNIPQPEVLCDLPENIEWIEISSSLNEEINKTVEETGLDWIMQVVPGDKLFSHTLLSFAEHINQHNQSLLIYSDEMINEKSGDLVFKPDFNLELLRSRSYLGNSVIIRRDAFEHIGGYTGLAYVFVSDLAFNIVEQWGREAISHIEDILYIGTESIVDNEILMDNEITVRLAHLERQGIKATLSALGDRNNFRVKYSDNVQPLVSIVIANKNHASAIWLCVNQILEQTDYPNYEIIIVDQQSDIEDMDSIYQEMKDELTNRFTLLSYAEENYSAMINVGISQAKGDYMVVIANSAIPHNDWWLSEMCSIAQQGDVGVVGAKILAEDNTLVHGGTVLGCANDTVGMFAGALFEDLGYMDRSQISQEYAAVSSSCFMVSKENYLSVGGLDEGELSDTRYCVTDFCLKVQLQGLRNIWTPHSVFRQNMKLADHTNGVCENYKENIDALIINKWPKESRKDPSYNRHLSLRYADFRVETDFYLGWGELTTNRPRIMVFPFNNTAIGHYRVIEPLRELAHHSLIESTLLPGHDGADNDDVFTPTPFELCRANPDVLVMHLTLTDAHYNFLRWIRSETNIFVIFSIDDLVQSLPKKNLSKKKMHKDILYRLRRTISLCDRVIVSTQPLADTFSSFCEDIVVVPNSIDLARWSEIKPTKNLGAKLRIGWAGGQHHAGDLDFILNVIKTTSDEVDWIFMGMCPEEFEPYIHEYHDFTLFSNYPEKLATLNLDLAIAPLEVHPFNEAKSNLRLLEYGMLGWPVICTDIYPYQTNNPPVVRVENTTEAWINAISAAISEPDLLKVEGEKLKQWVLSNYRLEQYSETWLSALIKR